MDGRGSELVEVAWFDVLHEKSDVCYDEGTTRIFWRHKCQSSDREILRGKFPYLEVDTRKGEGCE